jgi:magnesium transporter
MIDVYILEDGIKKISIDDIDKHKGKKWIDITGITQQERQIIKEYFNLHPLTAEDLANYGIRIKIEEFNDYLFCVFYGAKKKKKIELIEIDFILGKDYLITNHKPDINAISELKKDMARIQKLMEKGLDFMFHKILDIEVDNYFPILEEIDDELDKIQEETIKKPTAELVSKILETKRTLQLIERITMQQREKTSWLAKNEYKLLGKKSKPYFRDVHDHMIRVSDTIESYREAASNSFDVYMSTVSNNMNEVMKVLSIIATIA